MLTLGVHYETLNSQVVDSPLFSYKRLSIVPFKGRILLRESSQGESSGLRVRLEGLLKTHYDAYSPLANVYLLPANAYSLH